MQRWKWLLSDVKVRVFYLEGKLNVVPNWISRLKLVIKEEVLGKRGRRADVRPAELAVALPGVEHLVGDDGLVRLPIAVALLLANNASVVLPPHVEMEPVRAAAAVACEEAPAVDSALEKAAAAVASVLLVQPEYAERVLAVLRSASSTRAGPSASTRSQSSAAAARPAVVAEPVRKLVGGGAGAGGSSEAVATGRQQRAR
jgi:hypothetical protein